MEAEASEGAESYHTDEEEFARFASESSTQILACRRLHASSMQPLKTACYISSNLSFSP